jgi:UbiD family decarboxylase
MSNSNLRDFINKVPAWLTSNIDLVATGIREQSIKSSYSRVVIAKDSRYEFPVVGGVYASRHRVRSIVGLASDLARVKRFAALCDLAESEEQLTEQYAERVDRFIEDEPTNCQSISTIDVDLNTLPICFHNEYDSGKFITAGVQVVFDTRYLVHHLGIHRMKLLSKDCLGCLAPPNRRIGSYYMYCKENQLPMPFVILLGAPPSVVLASQAKVNHQTDKYIVASLLQSEPLKLLPWTGSNNTEGSTLLVPARTEIVLEGFVDFDGGFVNDGPFGEYPGTYSEQDQAFVVKINRITHKRDALYQTILTGMPPQEDSYLCAVPEAVEMYRVAKNHAQVTDISVFLGNCVYESIICIKKESDSQVKNLLYALLATRYVKIVTVMDHDLRADEEAWRWAFTVRYQPNRDTIITEPLLGASLDPSSLISQRTSKIGFDFTCPMGQLDKFKRVCVPPVEDEDEDE